MDPCWAQHPVAILSSKPSGMEAGVMSHSGLARQVDLESPTDGAHHLERQATWLFQAQAPEITFRDGTHDIFFLADAGGGRAGWYGAV